MHKMHDTCTCWIDIVDIRYFEIDKKICYERSYSMCVRAKEYILHMRDCRDTIYNMHPDMDEQ